MPDAPRLPDVLVVLAETDDRILPRFDLEAKLTAAAMARA
jgi:hypothetical protein